MAAYAHGAGRWWQDERTRNDSAYLFVPDLGDEVYAGAVARLPSTAFTDANDNDQWIYAQAMAHRVDILGSRNRRTIIAELLDEHFVAHGWPRAPVRVRDLWEHTAAVAAQERRPSAEVALEAMLCAIVPEAWESTAEHAARVTWSAEQFIANLRTRTTPGEVRGREREQLAHVLYHALKPMDAQDIIERCSRAHEKRPVGARQTERRYHASTRAEVRGAGLDLWDR